MRGISRHFRKHLVSSEHARVELPSNPPLFLTRRDEIREADLNDVNRYVRGARGGKQKQRSRVWRRSITKFDGVGGLKIGPVLPDKTTCALLTLLTCTPPPSITWRLRVRIYCL